MMIALFGYGKTTSAIAKKRASKFFADVEEVTQKDGFTIYPASFYNPNEFELAVPSPAIPPNHPLVKKSPNVLSDYDLFYKDFPFTIWVSGTNGKTTTTQMITHMLKKRGAVSGGNIGTPIASLPKTPIWVLETSSYTLHYTNITKPDIYILLPITPDHLSWHGGFEEYEKAKLKPLKRLREGELAIVPKRYENTPSNGFLVGYETPKEIASFFGLDIEKIEFQGPFLLDAIIALAVTKALFNESDYELLNSFKIDSHKQEEFFDDLGRLWVDDSKATNIDAAMEAIKRYQDRKIHLILGGDSKGVSLKPLIDFLKGLNIKVYAIGDAADEICRLCRMENIPFYRAQDLKIAVKEIEKELEKGQVALLSPACASLDQFKNYKERGEVFKQIILRKD